MLYEVITRATDEDVNPERQAALDGFGVVDPDPPVDLVVQSDLLALAVRAAGDLDPVHAEVGVAPPRPGRASYNFV